METHTQSRFSETPPGSPKSCMKGSRRLNFEDEGNSSAGGTSAPTSSAPTSSSHHHHHHHHHHSKKSVSHQADGPHAQSPTTTTKKSGKTVMIKSPGSEKMTTSTGVGTSCSMSTSTEIPFQFHLSQHYDNPPPPPNCTSNTAYEEERLKKLSEQATPTPTTNNEQNNSSESHQQLPPQPPKSLYKSHAEKLQQYDPQLVAIASKVVNEILQKATQEVANKQKQVSSDTKRGSTASASEHHRRDFFGLGRPPWYRRAHGVISKWVTNICVRAQNAMKT